MSRGSCWPAAVLAMGLFAAATGCSGPAATGKPHRVAFVIANSRLNFATEMADGFRDGVSHVSGVQQTVVGPPTVDGPKQLQLFQEQTKTSRDGVSVFTLSPDLFAEPLADAWAVSHGETAPINA